MYEWNQTQPFVRDNRLVWSGRRVGEGVPMDGHVEAIQERAPDGGPSVSPVAWVARSCEVGSRLGSDLVRVADLPGGDDALREQRGRAICAAARYRRWLARIGGRR